MNTSQQEIEITFTGKESAIIEALSRQCEMSHDKLVKTLLFESGILNEADMPQQA